MKQSRVLGLMFFLALVLPVTSYLGQQNQENRSMAAGLNSSCVVPSSCNSPDKCRGSCTGPSDIVCYGFTSRVCKVNSGGNCSRSSDCYSNHYCSRTTNHCRLKDKKWIGDYSVEGVSVSSMLGVSGGNPPSNPVVTQIPPTRSPTRAPTRTPTRSPTRAPTSAPTQSPTKSPTKSPTRTPTRSPTRAPTSAPTQSPTRSPTRSPTNTPTQAPTVTPLSLPVSESKISFKIAFDGISPESNCIDQFLTTQTKLNLNIENVPTNKFEENIQVNFEETNETDSKGNRIFKVTNLKLDNNKFGSVNNYNYIKIKGPWHLRRKMCLDEQETTLAESVVCNIDLKSDNIYDFSEYTLLAGDVSLDGVVNTVDLGWIKTRLNSGSDIQCGTEGDLNMDGVVNTLDLNLVKKTLTERDDE